ncbi:MAG TPA: hypothetical protein VKV73_16375 [Chloroflexota bacterium]|nr:hypothetical protein [Chloroflexota bacterium]
MTSRPGATSLASQVLGVISPLPLYLVLGWAGVQAVVHGYRTSH